MSGAARATIGDLLVPSLLSPPTTVLLLPSQVFHPDYKRIASGTVRLQPVHPGDVFLYRPPSNDPEVAALLVARNVADRSWTVSGLANAEVYTRAFQVQAPSPAPHAAPGTACRLALHHRKRRPPGTIVDHYCACSPPPPLNPLHRASSSRTRARPSMWQTHLCGRYSGKWRTRSAPR